MKELIQIQSELKAPKNQFNKFGGYKYRSLEDIQEAAKPVLAKYGCHLKLDYYPFELCGKAWFRCVATLMNTAGESLTTECSVEIDETSKGMSAPQKCGAAISYCGKYCVGALFLLDDTKDDDALNTHGKEAPAPKAPAKKAADPQPQQNPVTLEEAINDLKTAKTVDEYQTKCRYYKQFWSDPAFAGAAKAVKALVTPKTA